MAEFYAQLIFWGITLAKLLIASLCGGIIGLERERVDRPAGLRTHMLVCVGAAIYMLVSLEVAGDRFDPGRIAAQVATGVGFLGAGTIIKQGNIVRGLTTAASLWAVAGIGLAAGYRIQSMGIAVLGTLVVLVALELVKRVETRLEHRRVFNLTILLANPRQHADEMRILLEQHQIRVIGITFQGDAAGFGGLIFEGSAPTTAHLEHAVSAISARDIVTSVNWEQQ